MWKKISCLFLSIIFLTACSTVESPKETEQLLEQNTNQESENDETSVVDKVLFPESSQRKITAMDLAGEKLYSQTADPQLREQAIAEIYSRHELVVDVDYEKLTAIEQYNVTLLKELPQWDPEEQGGDTQIQVPHPENYTAYNKQEEVVVDLDGNGVDEKIMYDIKEDEAGVVGYELRVNETTLFVEGANYTDTFAIVDINTQDQLKEIAISDLGPSDDEVTTFYRYNGAELLEIGAVEGLFTDGVGINGSGVGIDGSGVVLSKTRTMTLPTWWLDIPYLLVDNHFKVNATLFTGYGGNVMTLVDLKVYKDTNKDEEATTLPKYTTFDIVGGDNHFWIQIKTKDDVYHWLSLSEDYLLEGTEAPPQDILLGLWFAD